MVTRFMGGVARFMGVCEIYGRVYEIYGSLRDLWELRDLWGVQGKIEQDGMILRRHEILANSCFQKINRRN